MKKLDLNNCGVQEMNAEEMRKYEGGGWPLFLVALAWSAWENVGDIRQGWSDGINGRPPRY